MKKLIKERRANPNDDLVTALVQAKDGSDQLSEDEILAMIFLLLIAGHETTVNLIGSGTLALLEHPDQRALLRHEPALIKTAIEELVRFVCPVEMATERYAREAITIAETTIPRGELVMAVIGSANRDPNYFDNPDSLDITRTNNKHLAFGHGVHYCLGASLARHEGQIAISSLVQRMPNLRLNIARDQLRREPGMEPFFAERARRFSTKTRPPGTLVEVHQAALRNAGFREVDVIWQHLDNRVVMAVR